MKKGWTKPVTFPVRSPELAEFMGIMIGDGGMTRYQVKVSLHHIHDQDYAEYVTELALKLFAVVFSVSLRPTRSLRDLFISRTRLVDFLISCGLYIGNKVRYGITIPVWIIEDPLFSLRCIRGIFDTDGCVVIHRYLSKGKLYRYKKLTFTSRSPALLVQIATILKSNDITCRVHPYDVWIDSKECTARYFSLVGTSNSKHLNRFLS